MNESQATVSLVDNGVTLETSTGVEIDLRTAGLCIRGIAYIIDETIRVFLVIAVLVFAEVFGNLGNGLATLAAFVIWWMYCILFEVMNNGVTPGKHIMNLRAVNADGTPIGFINSALRSLLLVADFLPFGYLFGIISLVTTGSQQRIGDLVAGTVVIYTDARKRRTMKVTGTRAKFPGQLTIDERMLFLSFQERVQDLSPERSVELAETLEPVLHKKGSHAVAEVVAIGEAIRTGS